MSGWGLNAADTADLESRIIREMSDTIERCLITGMDGRQILLVMQRRGYTCAEIARYFDAACRRRHDENRCS